MSDKNDRKKYPANYTPGDIQKAKEREAKGVMPSAVGPHVLKTAPLVEVAPGSAVKPVEYNYHETQGCAPFDRFDHLAHFLESNTHCYTPGVLKQLRKLVEQYEAMVGGKTHVGKTPGNPSFETTATVSVSEAHARKILADAEAAFIKAIAGYEIAAQLMMAVDFNRGLTVATWAKALRVKITEMKLEGA